MNRKESRILKKQILIVIGIIILLCLILFNKKWIGKQPEGALISIQDVNISLSEIIPNYTKVPMNEGENDFSFSQLEDLIKIYPFQNDSLWKQLKGNYHSSHFVKVEDWAKIYDCYITLYGAQNKVFESDLVIIGDSQNAVTLQDEAIASDQIVTTRGLLTIQGNINQDTYYKKIQVYQTENKLLFIKHKSNDQVVLKNLWITEATNEKIRIIFKNFIVSLHIACNPSDVREQVADITVGKGEVSKITCKKDKINGKIISVNESAIEIENQGIFPLAKDVNVYKLWGTREVYSVANLKIGYDFTDFVMDKGEIVACLVVRDGAMENIRVLLKTSNFTSDIHEKVELTCDSDFSVKSGEKTKDYHRGETIIIDKNSDLFENNRIYIVPSVLTSKIMISSIERSQGIPSYRGKIEIAKQDDGFVIVNELPLEEYLYAVVPSEMPSSYPLEALKVQAVCARTFAYQSMENSSLSAKGAHVDDSTAYQVYNNIIENEQTTRAVKETAGELVYFQDKLATTYYYSTSCGFGTTIEVWNGNQASDFPYLSSQHISNITENTISSESMQDEENFVKYISTVNESDFEKEEPWYRWNYNTSKINLDKMMEKINNRYQAVPDCILTKQNDGSYAKQEIGKLGKLKKIYIDERLPGGNANALIVVGSKNTFKIIKEYNIRYVLSDEETEVIRKDGSAIKSSTLLPSAYFVLTPKMDGKEVAGVSITGGGYGHGVGMSQNGAKAMAQIGMMKEDILQFFFPQTTVKNAY